MSKVIYIKLTARRLAYMGKAAVNNLNFVQPDQAVPCRLVHNTGQPLHWPGMAVPHPTDSNITAGEPQARSFHLIDNTEHIQGK